jgi:hypothetical protein
MRMLSEDDLNLQELTEDELDRAWDLWFDLAQATNDWDPPYSHGVLVGLEREADLPDGQQSGPGDDREARSASRSRS